MDTKKDLNSELVLYYSSESLINLLFNVVHCVEGLDNQ